MMHKASCTAIAWLGLTSLDVRAARLDERGFARVQHTTITDASELDKINPYAGEYKIKTEGAVPVGDLASITVTCTDEIVFKESLAGVTVKGPLELNGLKESCKELKGKAVMYADANKFRIDAIAFEDSLVFGQLDKNKNGKLEENEILKALEPILIVNGKKAEDVAPYLKLIISKVDTDDDGMMSKDEISSATEYLMKLLDPQFLITELADQLFKALDKDGNEVVSKEEMQKLASYLAGEAAPVVVALILNEADTNKDGQLSKQEFSSVADAVKKLAANPASVLDLVNPEWLLSELDSDKDESISKAELKALLVKLKIPVDEAKMETALEFVFRSADKNKDAKLSLDEISGVIPILKVAMQKALKDPYTYLPENKLCLSNVKDDLRVHPFVTYAPIDVPTDLTVYLELKEKDKCGPDKQGGAPHSAGFATVFALMVARFIAV